MSLLYAVILTVLVTVSILLPISLLTQLAIGASVGPIFCGLFVAFSCWMIYLELTGGGARHPQHAQDVAAAISWALANAGDYGGDSSRVFLAGHSAGAHLVTLLTLDRSYLRDCGVADAQFDASIQGVIGVSGSSSALSSPPRARAIRLLISPTIGVYNLKRLHEFKLGGLPLARWNFVEPAFTTGQYHAASPTCISRKVPQKFLLLIAERDHAPLKEDFAELGSLFSAAGIDFEAVQIPKKNHRSIMFHIDTNADATMAPIARWLADGTRFRAVN